MHLYGIPKVIHGQNISVGSDLELNHGSMLNATNSSIIIGNRVTISANAMIIAATYDVNAFLLRAEKHHIPQQILIGDDVWICAGAIVLGGVSITGRNVIVAAGAVVTKDINTNNCIVAGNPATIIKVLK